MSDMRGSTELWRALRTQRICLLTYPFHTCGAGFEGLDELEPIVAIQEKEISFQLALGGGWQRRSGRLARQCAPAARCLSRH